MQARFASVIETFVSGNCSWVGFVDQKMSHFRFGSGGGKEEVEEEE